MSRNDRLTPLYLAVPLTLFLGTSFLILCVRVECAHAHAWPEDGAECPDLSLSPESSETGSHPEAGARILQLGRWPDNPTTTTASTSLRTEIEGVFETTPSWFQGLWGLTSSPQGCTASVLHHQAASPTQQLIFDRSANANLMEFLSSICFITEFIVAIKYYCRTEDVVRIVKCLPGSIPTTA